MHVCIFSNQKIFPAPQTARFKSGFSPIAARIFLAFLKRRGPFFAAFGAALCPRPIQGSIRWLCNGPPRVKRPLRTPGQTSIGTLFFMWRDISNLKVSLHTPMLSDFTKKKSNTHSHTYIYIACMHSERKNDESHE